MPDVKKFLDQAGTSHLWSRITTELNKKAAIADLAAIATSGAASDINLVDTGNYYTGTDVETALQEIGAEMETVGTVSVSETAGSGNVLKIYTLSQRGQTIGTINIPKDLVATSGEIVDQDGSGNSGTFLKLVIANSDPIYVNVASLIEYNGVVSSSEITFTDTNHQISGTLAVGSIAKNKLDSSVQASLNLADSALQAADITEGSTLGTISVDGTNVAVHGLGSAAYTDSTAYDAAGEAQGVYDAIQALTNTEINTAISEATSN